MSPSVLMLLAYPLLSHLAVVSGHSSWAAVYLVFMVLFFLARALFDRNRILALAWGAALVSGAVLIAQEGLGVLVYVPPIAISLGLLLLFGRSLERGRTPMVTRYAQLIDGDLNPELRRYTRRVTQIWSLFFLLMLIETIVLALFASPAVWSLYANVLNYVAVAILFLAEYGYRTRVYSYLPKRTFVQFVRKIVQVRPSQLGT